MIISCKWHKNFTIFFLLAGFQYFLSVTFFRRLVITMESESRFSAIVCIALWIPIHFRMFVDQEILFSRISRLSYFLLSTLALFPEIHLLIYLIPHYLFPYMPVHYKHLVPWTTLCEIINISEGPKARIYKSTTDLWRHMEQKLHRNTKTKIGSPDRTENLRIFGHVRWDRIRDGLRKETDLEPTHNKDG